jgi:type II secretory pathway pseudopilin PulG
MAASHPIRPHRKPSEEGYILLAVIFLMAILALWLAVALPKMSRSIQRDRDLETMHRGKQYIRAVQLYYRKFGAYPPSMDALVKTNDIRFLRKKYIDPSTGKDDWTPIQFGQNKVPTAMGFFGQPLSTGSTLAGIGPTGGNGIAGANGVSSTGNFFGSTGASGFGNSQGNSMGGSMFGNAGTGNSGFGNSPTSPTDNSQSGSQNNSGNPSPNGSSSTDSNSGSNTGSTGGLNGGANGGIGGSSGTSGAGLTGQTFGGAGIIGFTPGSPKQSILVYKKKDHYKEWEFTYDPIMDQKMMSGGNTGMIGQPAGAPGGVNIPGILGPGSGPSSTPNSNSNGGPGSAPAMPPDTSAPQQ